MASQIGLGMNVQKPCLQKERADGRALVPAVLDDQPAAGDQMAQGAGCDFSKRIKSVGARGEGGTGLEPEVTFGQMRVGVGDVGWIGDDDLEALGVGECLPPGPREEAQSACGKAVTGRVFGRHGERVA